MTIQQNSYNRTIRIVLAFYCAWAASPLAAQDPFEGDNPFGGMPTADAADTFGASVATPAAARGAGPEMTADDPDPVVRMLRSHPPKTPIAMADGLTWTIRLKRWDEVGRLLDRMQSLNWSLEQRAQVTRRMGAAMVLRMRSGESTLSDAQKVFAAELYQAPAQIVRDPAWIDKAIDQLASLVPAERRAAQLRLHDASSSAIGRLVNRLLAGDTKVRPLQLASAASSFGADGNDALRAACLVADQASAARVILTLADLPKGEFGTELGAALMSRTLPAASQAALAASCLHSSRPCPLLKRSKLT